MVTTVQEHDIPQVEPPLAVTLKINGQPVTVPDGTSIMAAAQQININIPKLCFLEELGSIGACRVCVVEVNKEPRLATSCTRLVEDGMEVRTHTARVRRARRMVVEMLLANHVKGCFTCARNQNCELLKLAFELGVEAVRFNDVPHQLSPDATSPSIIRDPNKCVLCGRCVSLCSQVQTVNAIGFTNRGLETAISTLLDQGLGNVECVNCGQCIHVCPTGAIREVSAIDGVWAALADPEKHVVVQEAPAIRAALGEEFGMEPGSLVDGKLHAALRRIGFDAVFDTNFTADLTIMEEGSELVERVSNDGVLPLITSCSPGWVKFMEHFYPEVIPHVSSCKSPQQMFGTLAKTYYAEKADVTAASIVSVSVMPCTAKKYECQRPEMADSGYQDVDYVLTTRELARMLKEAGIDFTALPDEPADELMGRYSGAATIFGATGGVMEAAVRSAYTLVTGEELESIDLIPLRGLEGVKVAEIPVGSLNVKVAVAHGLGNARVLLDDVRDGKSPYHVIEIMACPGGCVGGGGQPIGFDLTRREERGQTLYREDSALPCRKSHQNPRITQIYEEFLERPLGEKSHHLLHTKYTERGIQ
jgi:NADH-quinone oxidoreductase subunit G